jgi:hypothetical protein
MLLPAKHEANKPPDPPAREIGLKITNSFDCFSQKVSGRIGSADHIQRGVVVTTTAKQQLTPSQA